MRASRASPFNSRNADGDGSRITLDLGTSRKAPVRMKGREERLGVVRSMENYAISEALCMAGRKSEERVDTAVESHMTRHFNEHVLPVMRPVEEAWGGLESSPWSSSRSSSSTAAFTGQSGSGTGSGSGGGSSSRHNRPATRAGTPGRALPKVVKAGGSGSGKVPLSELGVQRSQARTIEQAAGRNREYSRRRHEMVQTEAKTARDARRTYRTQSWEREKTVWDRKMAAQRVVEKVEMEDRLRYVLLYNSSHALFFSPSLPPPPHCLP